MHARSLVDGDEIHYRLDSRQALGHQHQISWWPWMVYQWELSSCSFVVGNRCLNSCLYINVCMHANVCTVLSTAGHSHYSICVTVLWIWVCTYIDAIELAEVNATTPDVIDLNDMSPTGRNIATDVSRKTPVVMVGSRETSCPGSIRVTRRFAIIHHHHLPP